MSKYIHVDECQKKIRKFICFYIFAGLESWVLVVAYAIERHTASMVVDFCAAVEDTRLGYEMSRKSVNANLYGAAKLNAKCAIIVERSMSAIKSHILNLYS